MESKLPWSVWICNGRVQIKDADGNTVLGIIARENDKDNAALIVHCANANDAQQQKIERLVNALRTIANSYYSDANREIAKDALKAEGIEL